MFGVRSSNVNDRSGRTVTRAGIGTPGVICAVRALNSCPRLVETRQNADLQYFAEIHAFDSFTSQSWSNGGAGTGLGSSHDQLYNKIFGRDRTRHLSESFRT